MSFQTALLKCEEEEGVPPANLCDEELQPQWGNVWLYSFHSCAKKSGEAWGDYTLHRDYMFHGDYFLTRGSAAELCLVTKCQLTAKKTRVENWVFSVPFYAFWIPASNPGGCWRISVALLCRGSSGFILSGLIPIMLHGQKSHCNKKSWERCCASPSNYSCDESGDKQRGNNPISCNWHVYNQSPCGGSEWNPCKASFKHRSPSAGGRGQVKEWRKVRNIEEKWWISWSTSSQLESGIQLWESSYHCEAEFIKHWIVHPLIGTVSWV